MKKDCSECPFGLGVNPIGGDTDGVHGHRLPPWRSSFTDREEAL